MWAKAYTLCIAAIFNKQFRHRYKSVSPTHMVRVPHHDSLLYDGFAPLQYPPHRCKMQAQFIRYLPQGVPFLVHLQYLLF